MSGNRGSISYIEVVSNDIYCIRYIIRTKNWFTCVLDYEHDKFIKGEYIENIDVHAACVKRVKDINSPYNMGIAASFNKCLCNSGEITQERPLTTDIMTMWIDKRSSNLTLRNYLTGLSRDYDIRLSYFAAVMNYISVTGYRPGTAELNEILINTILSPTISVDDIREIMNATSVMNKHAVEFVHNIVC